MSDGSATPSQHWDSDTYAKNASFVSRLGQPVVDLLAPRAGERILDLGCGDGALTEVLVDAGAEVAGIDASESQVAAARARGLDARVGDATALAFDREFDAVFSNAALHWVRPPAAAVAGVHRALRPGGRFVGEFGGAGNVRTIEVALIAALNRRGLDGDAANPWYFPTPEQYTELLTAAGFTVRSAELIPRLTPLPITMQDWLETLARPFFDAVPESEHESLKDEVADATRAALMDDDGRWRADYVRLRFAADKAG